MGNVPGVVVPTQERRSPLKRCAGSQKKPALRGPVGAKVFR